MFFSGHGLQRFLERTRMNKDDFIKIITSGAFVSLGQTYGERELCLFFNPADKKYNVAVMSANGTVISVHEESFNFVSARIKDSHRKKALKEFQKLVLKTAERTPFVKKFSVELFVRLKGECEVIKKFNLGENYAVVNVPDHINAVCAAASEINEVSNAITELDADCLRITLEFIFSRTGYRSGIIKVNLHTARKILASRGLLTTTPT